MYDVNTKRGHVVMSVSVATIWPRKSVMISLSVQTGVQRTRKEFA